ncbi:hypothetical protein LWI29_023746 [Acer saccharum]|uniref:Leucine-rich repeat-containing N-terminal plant-type domain-containing protein n=1 Tax=Acer saccharum TaxID=4024 RepID=A0AA39RYU9_ACESA|nr:hypothetical protein LWI29_023746 [Acer saccharum]
MLQIIDLACNNFTGRLPQKGLTSWEAMMADEQKAQSQLKHLQFQMADENQHYQDAVTVTMIGLEVELVKILTLFTSIDLSSNNFQGPIPEESDQQSLLLQLKDSLTFDSTLSLRLVQWNQRTDCCTWSGVDCDMAGRVIGLDLSDESILDGVDDSSCLFDLQHLRSLNLAFNLIEEIPSRLANLTNLTYLNLSCAVFGEQIPIEISSLTRRNNLNGIISGTFPRNCGLQTLELNGNQLEGMVPKSLANCTMLEVLDLGNNQINDTFPCWLKNVSSLHVLVLRSNRFYGEIVCPEVHGIWPRLQIVDLASNNFSGKLPRKCLTTWRAMMVDEDEAQSNFKHLRFEFLFLSRLYYLDSITVTSKANLFGSDVVLVACQCQSDQQSLLLQLKSSLNFKVNQSVHLVKWNQNTDCCNWSGVVCDVGGRVTGLNLSFESISGGIENSTGLFGLQHLRSLDLAYNQFDRSQIPSRLGNLSNLTYLNLSDAGFAGQIPVEISSLTRLVSLDLSSTFSFPGTTLLKLENPNLKVLVQNLTVLRELYLDGVNISANGNEWCQALSSSLLNLQVLSLSSCFLSGPIHSSLADLHSLSVIRLDMNFLSSPVPDFMSGFSNLTSLSLSSCGLNGTFPEKIFQVPTLETLDLSNNILLHGSMPHFPKNHSLRTLMLRHTNFSGYTLPNSIGNLKHLSRIELAGCNFTGTIPTSMSDLTELVYLDFSANNFSGQIPSFHLSKNLTYLDLSHNVLTGVISSIDWPQLVNLVHADLRNNLLNGSIPPSLLSLPSLQQLQLGNNQFDGPVLKLPNASSSVLDTLDLSGNNLEGPIPKSIFQLKNLNILLLSFNKFNGTVQFDTIQRLGNLTTLDLSYNSLAVNASSISSFLPRFTTLKLASCNLSKIPNLKNQSRLFHLDLSDNQIPGEVPNWIWTVGLGHLNLSCNSLVGLQEPFSISNLNVLDLHANLLQGKIPPPPQTAVYVDYSNNNLSSSIPADIGDVLSTAVFFSLSNNRLTGVIPQSMCNATNLKVLDLSNNSLSGTVPTCLTEGTQTLGVLNLRGNNLNGSIPGTFPRNCVLQTLDLNGNQLVGMVPKSLANCTMLEVLDLGNNQIIDTFPCWLKNVSSLHVLVLRSNKFYGNIGCPDVNVSWPRLQIVDLASNNFSGNLPRQTLTTWQAMMVDEDEAQSNFKHLRFEFLRLSQLYYRDALQVFDLASNNFTGKLPQKGLTTWEAMMVDAGKAQPQLEHLRF